MKAQQSIRPGLLEFIRRGSCIELTPIQYALVHNSVVSMYKYMFINVPNLWLSFLIQFHFVNLKKTTL